MKWVFLLVLLCNAVLFGLGATGKLPAPPGATGQSVAHGLPPLMLWSETGVSETIGSPPAAATSGPASRSGLEGGPDTGNPLPAEAPGGTGSRAPEDPPAGLAADGSGMADAESVIASAPAAAPDGDADAGAVPAADDTAEPAPAADTGGAEPGGAGGAAPRHCYRAGPFTDEDTVRQVGGLLEQGGARVEQRIESLPQVQAYWVLQSGFADRDAALGRVRDLRGNGVDSFVITDAGHENDVSLGLFRQESAAHRHRATLAEKGIEAEVTPRERFQEVTWLLLEDRSPVLPDLPDELAAQAMIEGVDCP